MPNLFDVLLAAIVIVAMYWGWETGVLRPLADHGVRGAPHDGSPGDTGLVGGANAVQGGARFCQLRGQLGAGHGDRAGWTDSTVKRSDYEALELDKVLARLAGLTAFSAS